MSLYFSETDSISASRYKTPIAGEVSRIEKINDADIGIKVHLICFRETSVFRHHRMRLAPAQPGGKSRAVPTIPNLREAEIDLRRTGITSNGRSHPAPTKRSLERPCKYAAAWVLSGAGFALQVAGFAARIAVAGRARLQTCTSRSFGCHSARYFFALVFEAIYRSR